MAAYVEAREQLADALAAWDYTALFADDWPVAVSDGSDLRGPMIVTANPYDLIDTMLREGEDSPVGQMTQPVISIAVGHSADTFRSLGDRMASPLNPPASGYRRKGTRVGLVYLVSCWADRRLGGQEMVEKLGGEVQGCVFYNRTRLAAYRHLRCHNQEPAYIDREEIWTMDLYVEGDAVVSYDELIS